MNLENTAGFNRDQQDIIYEYEKVIDELQNELDYVKKEHTILKSKITTLINENKLITKQFNDLFIEKSNADEKESELIQSLKQQISILTTEKEYTTKLWQNAMTTIDTLEDELRIYHSGVDGFISKKEVSKIKVTYEERLKHVSSELSSTKEKLQALSKNNSNTLIAKFSEIDKSLEVQENSFKIIKNLEEEILNLQQRLQEALEVRQRHEKHIKEQERHIAIFNRKNEEYINKVKESIQIVEAALIEKDGALLREKECTDKITELSNLLSDYMREAEEKINKETYAIKEDYEEKLRLLEKQLRTSDDEIKIKSFEIEKLSEKCISLENEIKRINKGSIHLDESSTSKLLILEKNLEGTFQKLLISEKQNIVLASQRDAIKNDMDEMARHFERDIKTREIEKLGLQHKIKQLQAELDETNLKYCKSTESITHLNNKVLVLEKEFNENIENRERYLRNINVSEMSELKTNYNDKIDNLKSQLELQREINNRWRTETKRITENLEKLIADLKIQINRTKKENRKLLSKLKFSDKKIKEYKAFLVLISKDVSKITETTVNLDKNNA